MKNIIVFINSMCKLAKRVEFIFHSIYFALIRKIQIQFISTIEKV